MLPAAASIQEGFFLLRYAQFFRTHLDRLVQLLDSGKITATIDPRRREDCLHHFYVLDRLCDSSSYPVGSVVSLWVIPERISWGLP